MKKVVAGVLCAALAVCMAGCGAKDKAADNVRVCEVTHSIFYAPQYVAIAQGFFAQEGIAVELSNGGGADKVMSAVLSGDVDVGLAGPESCVYVYNEGRENYAQVFAQLTCRDGSFLVGRAPDPAFTWAKLAGKHVLPGRKGGVPFMTFSAVLRENGLDPATDLTLDTSVQFDMMTGAFLGGTGDYVTVFEPTASSIEAEGKGYIVASVGEASGEIPYTAYFAQKDYLTEHAALAQRFVNALYKGQQWVQTHTAQEIAAAVKDNFADTDPALLASAIQRYKDIGAYATTPVLTPESLDRLQSIIQEAGELTAKAPHSAIVENAFAQKALQDG